MAYHHRKLFQETISINRSENPCQLFCDPANESGFCPTQCFSLCSSICYYPLQSLVPPTYNTPTTTYVFDQETRIHKIFPYLIVTLVVLAIAFFIVCHYSIYVRFYSRRGRSQSRNQNQSQNQEQEQITTHDQFLEHGPELDHPIWYIRTVGLQPTVISAISVCKYKKNDGLVEGTECPVCLSEFQEGETLRLLPKCNHAFHIPCIDTWLGSHTNCPMCRAGIVVNVVAASPSPEPNVDILANSEETQVRISEDIELPVEIEINGIENSKERVGGIQPIGRSVSMDSASTSMASLALANNNAINHPVKLNESSSSSSSMKRSLSSYSWRRTSVLPQ